ncbi:hemolysin XhlA family protein [Bacillus thuringiensis]|uniref:hemolysin XhlA family protein n=1 Tax=Bacillus thuringiensis TaxID=1428 RepID=UPI00345A5B9C
MLIGRCSDFIKKILNRFLEIKGLEIRTTGNEKDIININKQLDKISANTTWILRLIVGGIVGGILTFLMKGGGM